MSTAAALKKNNALNILNVLRDKSEASKPEIAKITGLTGTTVHYIVNELLNRGILKEKGVTVSSGGRKPLLYEINPDCGFVIGISIRLDSITVGLFDICMKLCKKIETPYNLNENSVGRTIETIIKSAEELISSSQKIIGIGVNVPGPVDHEKGIVNKLAGAPSWINIPLKERLEQHFKINTIVDKDTSSCVLYLKKEKNENKVFLSTKGGIGTGILINGSVYRGVHGIAGEIGHNSVSAEGRKCVCGNTGCLELYASDTEILKSIRKISGASVSFDDILPDASKYEEYIKENMSYIVKAIFDLIRIYDPNEIVIESDWIKTFGSMFFRNLEEQFKNERLIDPGFNVTLTHDADIILKAAAYEILEYQYSSHDSIFLK